MALCICFASGRFEVVAFSRLPYISAGDADEDLAYLDDLMLLARPVHVHATANGDHDGG